MAWRAVTWKDCIDYILDLSLTGDCARSFDAKDEVF